MTTTPIEIQGTLREDGMRWAGAGIISLEEVVRVTRE